MDEDNLPEVPYFEWYEVARVPGYPEVDEVARAHIRLDNCCKNTHGSFAITCECYGRGVCRGEPKITEPAPNGKTYVYWMWSCGCQHDLVAKAFPHFAPFIRWHLCDATGVPMHYVANGTFWAEGAFGLREPAQYDRGDPGDHFRSTVVFGAVENDAPMWELACNWIEAQTAAIDHALLFPSSIGYIQKERRRQVLAVVDLAVTWWCIARLPLLIAEFHSDMAKLREMAK